MMCRLPNLSSLEMMEFNEEVDRYKLHWAPEALVQAEGQNQGYFQRTTTVITSGNLDQI